MRTVSGSGPAKKMPKTTIASKIPVSVARETLLGRALTHGPSGEGIRRDVPARALTAQGLGARRLDHRLVVVFYDLALASQ